MGRLLIALLIVAAIVLIWKAFGPGSGKNAAGSAPQEPRIKGPDDDEEFLWRLQKEQFKRRRAEEGLKKEGEGDSRAPERDTDTDDGEQPAG